MTPELLRNVDFSFSMFCHNRQSYLTIREQGERDLLSGLYNRNRFEMDDSMEELVRAAEEENVCGKRGNTISRLLTTGEAKDVCC